MSNRRYAANVDAIQPDLVKALRKIPGVSVQVGHDDILIGISGRTYWIEIKEPGAVSKRTGEIRPSEIKDSQKKILNEWTGHYAICWNMEQILTEIGIIK